MKQYQDIESIIKAHGGFISKGELTSVQYHRLLAELGNGSIVRVRKGVYALQDALLNTMYDMGKIKMRPGRKGAEHSVRHNLTHIIHGVQ